jgi:hypothetical protein
MFIRPKTPEALLRDQMRRSEPEISWAFVPRIQPGDYPNFSRSATIYWDRQFKRWVCAVQFSILNDSLTEAVARLTWYLNLGPREKPHAGRRGNFWAAWVKANGGPPKRNDRLSPRAFERRNAIVRVEDTTKNHRQNFVAEREECYSVIRHVVEWHNERPSQ